MHPGAMMIGAAAAALVVGFGPAEAGQRGVWTRTTPYHPIDGPVLSNHPYPWEYHSTYPWAERATYHAGPGAYYPAKRYRKQQARGDYRWTGYPPRHFYVVTYNGYAPQYGYPAAPTYRYGCSARC